MNMNACLLCEAGEAPLPEEQVSHEHGDENIYSGRDGETQDR